VYAAIYGGSPSIQMDSLPGAAFDEPVGAAIRIVLSCVCGTYRKRRMGTWL